MKPIISSKKRRYLWRSLTVAAVMWMGLTVGETPMAVPETASAHQQHKRTAAYVYDRAGLTLRDGDAANMDQMNYSFALIKNGEVSGSHWQSIEAFKAYIGRHPHILPVLSVGGWGADGFSQAAASAEGRAKFVDSALSLMEEHGFLGLDIDWEYPGSSAAGIATHPNDREHFTLLLSDLRKGLDGLAQKDGRPRLLAVALSADPSMINNVDCAAIGGIVDQVNLMTYDLQARKVSSHHTPLYTSDSRYPLSADSAVKAFIQAGIPANKIMLGAAFYARIFTMPSADDVAVFAAATDSGSKTIKYRTLIAESGWEYFFDDKAKAPYAVNGKRFATYDSALSISHKGAYVKDNNLMGLMCWEYGGDANGELLSAMHSSLN